MENGADDGEKCGDEEGAATTELFEEEAVEETAKRVAGAAGGDDGAEEGAGVASARWEHVAVEGRLGEGCGNESEVYADYGTAEGDGEDVEEERGVGFCVHF